MVFVTSVIELVDALVTCCCVPWIAGTVADKKTMEKTGTKTVLKQK